MFTVSSDIVKKRYPKLAQILEVLSNVEGVRSDLVKEIQESIRKGEYLTEEKLNVAISRLLKEILG